MKKVAGYRVMLGKTQSEIAELIGISKQSYSLRERGLMSFKDHEKEVIVEIIKGIEPDMSIEKLFFK